MAFPTVPTIDYSYTAFQQAQGNNEFPGTQLDNDLANLVDGLEEVRTFLEQSFRADGGILPGVLPTTGDLTAYGNDLADIYEATVAAKDEAVAAAESAVSATEGKADVATTLAGYGITDAAPLSHVGSGGSAHALATTSAHGFLASADKSKLDGIASGATANSSDATLLDRANHTGSQAISTVTGLQTALDAKAPSSHVGSTDGHPTATTSADGFMASTDKTNLDGIISRMADMIFLTDFMSASKLAAYRAGSAPDITAELAAFDAALPDNGRGFIPVYDAEISSTVSKRPDTQWVGMGGAILPTWSIVFDGVAISIAGTGASRDGLISGLRFLGDTGLYPNAVAIDADGCFTHRFVDLRIGQVKRGIDAATESHALYFERVYTWSCTEYGIYLEGGTSHLDCTDHWFFQNQLTGDIAGLMIKNAATPSILMTRPQGSGTANCILDTVYAFTVEGHYNDSAVIHSSGGGANGLRLINCVRGRVANVEFYSNGASDADIEIYANDGPSTDLTITGCMFLKASGQSGEYGIRFNTPTGAGYHRRVIIANCNMIGVDIPISGTLNVDSELHVHNNIVAAYGPLEAVTEVAGGTVTATRPWAEVFRFVGTAAAFNFTLPAAGNFNGRRHRIVRASGTGGIITVQQPSGTTLTTIPATANAWVDVVCSVSSSTVASIVYSVIGT